MFYHERRLQPNWETPVEESLPAYLVAAYFQTLLYGIYSVLFGLAVYLLYKNRASTCRLLPIVAILLFALATGDIALTHYHLFREQLKGRDQVLRLKHIYAKILLYVTSNAVADTFLVYRCYSLWGQRKPIVVVPAITLLLASTAIGYAFQNVMSQIEEYRKIYFWLVFAMNTSVTFLTALQIWSISQELSRVLGPEHKNKSHYATAIVYAVLFVSLQGAVYSALAYRTESGVLYSIYVLLTALVKSVVLYTGLTQIAGIVPTIIIVRVGLGRHTRSVKKTMGSVVSATQQQTETAVAEESSGRN